MRRLALSLIAVALLGALLVACAPPATLLTSPTEAPAPTAATAGSESPPWGRGMGQGPGMGGGMMARHHAVVPEEYAGLSNPLLADEQSLARGQALYEANCASCHGETGMGEGPAGQALDPPASPVAHTSQMLSDAYLFWRISEGGAAFGTAMPAWKAALDRQARWDLVNYLRSLEGAPGRGPGPGAGMGLGPGSDEGQHRAEMLAEAVDLGVITQADAELFEQVHQVLDEAYGADQAGMEGMGPRGMQAMQRALTGQAVRDGRITQEMADRFSEIHDLLIEVGMMQ